MATQPLNSGVEVDGAVGSSQPLNFETLFPQIVGKFLDVIEATIIIIAGYFLIRYIRNKLRKLQTLHENQRTALNLVEKITSGFIIVIATTLALKVVGIDMTLLVSVAILGLSYGLQDIIKNYVAGILILFKAPFKIGDVVKIRDFTGKVAKIDFQSTTMETFDNRQITIYNSDVMTQSIINFTNNTVRRLELDVVLGYNSDNFQAMKTFETILQNYPQVLKNPKFSIIFKKFGDNGITFTLKFWVQRPCNILKIKTDIANLISQSFDEENLYFPYSKGIEVNNDGELSNIPEKRKNRVKNFLAQPIFATETVQSAEESPIDFEEPE